MKVLLTAACGDNRTWKRTLRTGVDYPAGVRIVEATVTLEDTQHLRFHDYLRDVVLPRMTPSPVSANRRSLP